MAVEMLCGRPTSAQYGIVVAVALAMVLCVAGCGAVRVVAPCDPGQSAILVVQSSTRVNLAEDGRSLPTVVRIYQLKSIAHFENAEFDDVWKRDKETLGEDVLQMDDLTIYPSQTFKRSFKRNPKATHVVAMAVFRQPAGISWRVVYELPPSEAEKRCAMLQVDPKVKLKLPIEPRFYLFLEDYRIEPLDEPMPDPENKKDKPKLKPGCCDT